jgi:hypothetical protein
VRPVVTHEGVVILPLEVSALLRHEARRQLERNRSDALQLPEDIIESLERIRDEGDALAKTAQHRATPSVAPRDKPCCDPVEWISVQTARQRLNLKTDQGVTALLGRESLHGEQDAPGRPWRVCAASVAARLERTTCRH